MARRCLLCVAKYYLGPIFVLSRVIFTHVHLIAIELYLPFYHLNVLYCVCISSVKLMCKLSNLSHDLLNAEYQRYSALILKITLWRCRLFFPYGEKKKQTNYHIFFVFPWIFNPQDDPLSYLALATYRDLGKGR